MQIVIDIPEERLKSIRRFGIKENEVYMLSKAIIEGKKLPKHHGRLISADSLITAIEEKSKRLSNLDTINGLCGAVALIFDEPTIIEADAESEVE